MVSARLIFAGDDIKVAANACFLFVSPCPYVQQSGMLVRCTLDASVVPVSEAVHDQGGAVRSVLHSNAHVESFA